MKYYISTIADIDYIWHEDTNTEEDRYVHHTGPAAKEYGLGLELAEFCLSANCEDPGICMDFFEENAANYTKDLVLHAPYNELMPHAIDPGVVELCRKRYDMAYRLCEKYGCSKMIVHANYVRSLYYESWFIDRQIKFWKSFLAEHKGSVIICLENVMEYSPSLITDIIKAVDSPYLRMCLDAGHANLHDIKPMQWLQDCAPYISHLHIHNNNGPVSTDRPSMGDLHRSLPDGIIDYKAFLTKADELIPEGLSATIESADFQSSISWLRENNFI